MSKNDITGDSIRSRVTTRRYRDNYDAIFGSAGRNEDILDNLYAIATDEYEKQGLVSLTTLNRIIEAGGDVSDFT